MCTVNKDDRRTGVNSIAICLGSAGAEMVDASVFGTRTFIVFRDNTSIGNQKVKVRNHVNVDRRGADGKIEATL